MNLKNILLAIRALTFMVTPVIVSAQAKPDFAAPQTLIAQSRQEITQAVKQYNEPQVIRSLINLIIAENQIDPLASDSLLQGIDATRNLTSAPVTSLRKLLLAEIYASHSQLKAEKEKSLEFIKEALSLKDELINIPLKEYESILTDYDARIFTNLYQFVAFTAIDLLKSQAPEIYFPQKYMCDNEQFSRLKFDTYSPACNLILETYAALIPSCHGEAAIYATLEKIHFLESHILNGRTLAQKQLQALYTETQSPQVLIALDDYMPMYDPYYYNQVKEALEQYPENGCLKNILSARSQASISLSFPVTASPKEKILIKATVANTDEGEIYVYKIRDSWSDYVKLSGNATPLRKIALKTSNNTIPFQNELTAELVLNDYGTYALVPVINAEPQEKRSLSKLTITDLTLVSDSQDKLWVRNPVTGQAVTNAQIVTKEGKKTAQSQAEGLIKLTGNKSLQYKLQKGSDLSMPYRYYPSRQSIQDPAWRSYVTGTTALAVCKPGDKMQFMATAYQIKGKQRRLLTSETIIATLRDANYQIIASDTLLSDSFGRIASSFAIPDDCLTGRFSISFLSDKKQLSGNLDFMVSDYKQPSFKILPSPTLTEDSTATLSGKIMTYSGFPVTDASIDLALSVSLRNRWWRPGEKFKFYQTSAKTNPQGEYEIAIPKQAFEQSPIPYGSFEANLLVTSPAGESHEENVSFSLRPSYSIFAEIPANINASENQEIKANIKNQKGEIINQPISYAMTSVDSIKTYRGSWPIDFHGISSGKYNLKLWAAEADTIGQEIIVYRPDDKESPDPESLFWTPYSQLSGNESLLYGLNHEASMLITLTQEGKVIKQYWLFEKKGMHHLNISLPENCQNPILTIGVIGNRQSDEKTIKIITKTETPLVLKTTSFRNHATPGTQEQWCFTLTPKCHGALIIDAWNQALDAILPHNAVLYFNESYTSGFYINLPRFYSLTNSVASSFKTWKCESITAPEFQTYGYPLTSTFYHRPMLRMNAALGSAKVMKTADLALTETTQMDKVAATENPIQAKELRSFQKPLLLFEPLLTTDSTGNYNLKVTIPDELTTWQIKAIAYNEKMQLATWQDTLEVSKPLMVSSTLPRFVRHSDMCSFYSTIMNNSDEGQRIISKIEIFNPLTNQIIANQQDTLAINPWNSKVQTIQVKIGDLSQIGYRITADSKAFSDGEQFIIPVLEAATPIIETQSFILDSLQSEISFKLNPSATQILEYCQNPDWAMVQALPSLMDFESSTAMQAIASLFSAAKAKEIIANNPEIESALKQWATSDSLIPVLEKNPELKIITLQASPWVNQASSESERLAKLALYLDPSNFHQAEKKAISLLKKLQNPDGGLRWLQCYEKSSLWATEQFLQALTEIDYEKLGLNEQVKKAIEYLDNEYQRMAQNIKNFTSENYTFLRQQFSQFPIPTRNQIIINATIQNILKNWEHAHVTIKGRYALILYRAGYANVAQEILKSIDQYARSSREKGMYWPSILGSWYQGSSSAAQTAFLMNVIHTIKPDAFDLEQIKKWLILNKLDNDWGNTRSAMQIISSVLKNHHLTSSHEVNITFNNKDIYPEPIEALTGSITMNLSGESGNVTITDPAAANFSTGAFYTISNREADRVKAAGCDALKLERTYSNAFKKGEKVTITLKIDADKEMDYVCLIDSRPVCFEPVDQLPQYHFNGAFGYYQENRDSQTRIWIEHLPRGRHEISYEVYLTSPGVFSAPPAKIQSQYNPALTAHSSGKKLEIR